ncbi:MAG TPA: hypothetical protein VK190_02585 [Pseudoneobacillus sp.]|nr:hypothetical protein [Pseudoneobacillus sp.]
MTKEDYLTLSMYLATCKGIKYHFETEMGGSARALLSSEKYPEIWFEIQKNDKQVYIQQVYYKKENIIHHMYSYCIPSLRYDGRTLYRRLFDPKIEDWLEGISYDTKHILDYSINNTTKICKVVHDVLGHNGKSTLVYGARYRTLALPLLDKDNIYVLTSTCRGNGIEPWSLHICENSTSYYIRTDRTRVEPYSYLKGLDKRDDAHRYQHEFKMIYKIFPELAEKQLKNKDNCDII